MRAVQQCESGLHSAGALLIGLLHSLVNCVSGDSMAATTLTDPACYRSDV